MPNATEPTPPGAPINFGPTTKLRMTTGTAISIIGAVILAVWVAGRLYSEHSSAVRDISQLKNDASYLKRCMRILFRHEGIPVPEENDTSDEGVFPTAAAPTGLRRPQ